MLHIFFWMYTTYLCLGLCQCTVKVSCLTVYSCKNWHGKAKSHVRRYLVLFMISGRWIQLLRFSFSHVLIHYNTSWNFLQELCCTISFLAFLILLSAKAFGETTRDVKNTESQARYTRTMNFCPDYFPVLPIFQDNMQGMHVRSCDHLDCEGP